MVADVVVAVLVVVVIVVVVIVVVVLVVVASETEVFSFATLHSDWRAMEGRGDSGFGIEVIEEGSLS